METFKTRYVKTMLQKYIRELRIEETGVLTGTQLDHFIDGYI